MKVRVDRYKCIGCGLCAGICPEVFEMDADGVAAVKVEVVPKDCEDKVGEATESCPVEAIEID